MAQVIPLPTAGNSPRDADDVLGPIKKKVEASRRDRGRLEPVWHSNRAFAAGKQWLKWSRYDRRLMLDPKDVEGGRERYTVDLLTQYLKTAEGQLAGLEERDDLLFRREDIPSEDFSKAANDGLDYAWEVEAQAHRVLAKTKRRIIVDGTAAVRCRFDPTVGRDLGPVPIGQDGKPILDSEAARAYVAERQYAGEQVKFQNLQEGRILLEPLSVFNLLVPPGIEDENDFPWEAIIRAVPIDTLIQLYGEKAQGLAEEPLGALEMLGVKEQLDSSLGGGDPENDAGQPGKLEGHAALISYFERPCSDYPQGRVVNYAGNSVMAIEEKLPCRRPNGDWSSGISYFFWNRVEGRFHGRGLVESGKKVQRVYNRAVQLEHETIERGQPYMIAERDMEVEIPREVLQLVRYTKGLSPPAAVQGIGPGPWMETWKNALLQDLERVMGLHGVSLGEEATRQDTYAALALQAEKDAAKLGPAMDDFQESKRRLEEFVVFYMRRYWPTDKMIALAGDEDMAEAVEFRAQQLPEFFLLKVGQGSKPRSQGAELQLVSDLFTQSLNSKQPLPLQWYYDSIKAGKAMPLPDVPSDAQLELAKWQNSQLSDGVPVQAQDWHDIAIHLPEHEQLRAEAEQAGNEPLLMAVSDHIAADQAIAAQRLARQMAAQAEQANAAQVQPDSPAAALAQPQAPAAPAPPQ